MILFYYRELRRRIESLEDQHLPKPTVLVYLEALDENGEPWNIVGPNYYWFRDDNDPNDKPPPIPEPGGERVDQPAPGAYDNWDMPEPGTPPSGQAGAVLDLPPFGHNQSPPGAHGDWHRFSSSNDNNLSAKSTGRKSAPVSPSPEPGTQGAVKKSGTVPSAAPHCG